MKWNTVLILLACNVSFASAQTDASAVAKRIDAEIAKGLQSRSTPASPLADDAEFLRRVSLDLTGQIPTYERVASFLASKDPQRRAKLIDELLSAPEFGQHFAGLWSNLVLGQEINNAGRVTFRNWLAGELNKNVGWDKTVATMLTAEGEPKQNPASVFILAQTDDNKLMPNLMAASTTRYFLGVQLQCAECHNHPFTGWKQTEFWGVAAFFRKVKNLPASKTPTKTPTGISEAPAPVDPKKKPVATTTEVGATIVIPNTAGKGAGKTVKAKFLEGAEPEITADAPFRPSLAQWVTSRENKFFARATVNRAWAHLFGRGIVSPVDDMHEENEPSHPELLTALAEDFKASGFDVKHLLRSICNSQTYQRSGKVLEGNKDDKDGFSRMAAKVMNSEVLYDSLTRALAVKELNVNVGKTATIGIGGAAKAGASNNRDKFVKFFKTQDADSLATDFTHGIPQALNLMNDPQFNKGGPAVDKILAEKLTQQQGVERLFLSVLARAPTALETKRLVSYLETQDPAQGYAGILWALVNSPEFILIR